MKIYTILILSLLLTNCTITKNSLTKNNETESKIDSILVSLNQNGKFNGNVLVAKNDEIIYNKAFGFSSGDKQARLKPTDRFNIGSIYKEIPAIAIMQLKEKELLEINDPINKYISDLPSWSNQITILNLLQYTSGLPKINWGKHKIISDKTLMGDLLEVSDLEPKTGQNYLYTNYSPFLLSIIVERITKQSFPEYVEKNIIKPLKLKNSGFNHSFPYMNKSSMAISFNSQFVEDNPPFILQSPMFLFSTTTEDLFTLVKNIHTFNLIDESSLKTIGKKADLDIDTMESPLGQVTFDKNRIIEHTHHGSSGNYECIINRNVLKNNTVIILTNSKNDNVHTIKDHINKLL